MERKRYGARLETLAKFAGRSYCGPWCAHQAQSLEPEPLPCAASRPRRYKRRIDSRLDGEQIRLAYTAYKSGLSTEELGRRGWRVWGYKSPAAAALALRRAFQREGYKMRGHAERKSLSFTDRRCSMCGVDWEVRTVGCVSCRSRHNQRRWASMRQAA